jgi:hypothetical protein
MRSYAKHRLLSGLVRRAPTLSAPLFFYLLARIAYENGTPAEAP